MAAEDGAPQPKEFRKIAVFCGASSGSSPVYVEAAKALGEEMVRRGIGLVYGGKCTPGCAVWLTSRSCDTACCNHRQARGLKPSLHSTSGHCTASAPVP